MLCCGADPVWAGQTQLWSLVTCGVGQRQVLGGFLLGSTPAEGLLPVFHLLGFITYPWAALVTISALG